MATLTITGVQAGDQVISVLAGTAAVLMGLMKTGSNSKVRHRTQCQERKVLSHFLLMANQSCDSGVEAGSCPLPKDVNVQDKAQEVTLSHVPITGMALPHPVAFCFRLPPPAAAAAAAATVSAALLWAMLGSCSPVFL